MGLRSNCLERRATESEQEESEQEGKSEVVRGIGQGGGSYLPIANSGLQARKRRGEGRGGRERERDRALSTTWL